MLSLLENLKELKSLKEQTLLNQSGFFFFVIASVVPKPAIIPAVATVPRKIPPAKKSWRNKNQDFVT